MHAAQPLHSKFEYWFTEYTLWYGNPANFSAVRLELELERLGMCIVGNVDY